VDSTHGHSWDLLAWHGLCGAAMLAMLLVALPSWTVLVGPLVFGAGVVWAAGHVVRRERTAAYVRVGLCCAAMLVMVVPAWSTSGDHGTTMPGMARTGSPSALALASAAVMVVVALIGLSRLFGPGPGRGARVGLAVEPAVAVAMAAMLAGLTTP
jgi:hypothetical protein